MPLLTQVTAAAAIQMYLADPVTGGWAFALVDSSVNIGAYLDDLEVLAEAGDIVSVTLTDFRPLLISAQQYLADTAILRKLAGLVTLRVYGVPAARVATVQADPRVIAFSVSDTAPFILSVIGPLNQDSKLVAINLTGGTTLTVSAAQYKAYAGALIKVSAKDTVSISGVTATVAGAAAAQADPVIRSFAVIDTAAHVAAGLAALNGDHKLSVIMLTDSAKLPISYAQWLADTIALAALPAAIRLVVSGVSPAGAAIVQANPRIEAFSVSGGSVAVAAALTVLKRDSKLTGITLTDGKPLALSYAAFLADRAVLGRLPASYRLAITGATAAAAAGLQANTHVASFAVADTAAHVAAGLSALKGDSKLTTIAVSDGKPVTLTYGQFAADRPVLTKLTASSRLAIKGATVAEAGVLQADAHVAAFTVTDTSADVAAALDALNRDSKLTSIVLRDAKPLSITGTQFAADTHALAVLPAAYTLVVTNVSAAAAATVGRDPHVRSMTVSDSLARIGANLNSLEALIKAGKLTSISVSNPGQTLTLSSAQYNADLDAITMIGGAAHVTEVNQCYINLVWDPSVAIAPAGFKTAMEYAAGYFESLITNPITVSVTVGYGEFGGTPLSVGDLGVEQSTVGYNIAYGQFKSALAAVANSAAMRTAVANLPATDPTGGATLFIEQAEAKALALAPGWGTEIDANIGFGVNSNGAGGPLFSFDPTNRAVGGLYDFIGVAEHELSHALGRVVDGASWEPLNLFRYASPGVLGSVSGGAAYFSIDGGKTNLDNFSTTSDPGDWAASAGNDANVAYSNPGVANLFSRTDITELNALGYQISPAAAATPAAGAVIASAAAGLHAASLSFIGSPRQVVMGTMPATVDYKVAAGGGIEAIAGFRYGLDQLRIDLAGTPMADLAAFDTTVGGQHAVSLASNADLAHGVVLLGMGPGQTAADLMAHHLTFAGGEALVA